MTTNRLSIPDNPVASRYSAMIAAEDRYDASLAAFTGVDAIRSSGHLSPKLREVIDAAWTIRREDLTAASDRMMDARAAYIDAKRRRAS